MKPPQQQLPQQRLQRQQPPQLEEPQQRLPQQLLRQVIHVEGVQQLSGLAKKVTISKKSTIFEAALAQAS